MVLTALFTIHCSLFMSQAVAQRFFNLTADEVKIDSLLPVFIHQQPLGPHYADSTYEVTIEYPEFIPMSKEDIARYQHISGELLPAMPTIRQVTAVNRKQGELIVSFVPLVFRNGQYQKLVSFKLDVRGKKEDRRRSSAISHHTSVLSRYADHSVLSSGQWAKIRVPSSGIYQLDETLV